MAGFKKRYVAFVIALSLSVVIGFFVGPVTTGAATPKKVVCSKNHKKMTEQACKKLVVKKIGMTKAQYATKYEAIVAPANAALTTMQAQAKSLPSSPTAAQLIPVVQPAIDATNKALSQLAAIQWPGQTEIDMRALITADGNIAGDLQALESANALTASGVETKLSEDEGAGNTAADLVHADLGLPQPSA